VIALTLLLVLLLSIHHWLLEPLLSLGEAMVELTALPWLALGLLAWLIAGRSSGRDS
jgi:hypothetical protein